MAIIVFQNFRKGFWKILSGLQQGLALKILNFRQPNLYVSDLELAVGDLFSLLVDGKLTYFSTFKTIFKFSFVAYLVKREHHMRMKRSEIPFSTWKYDPMNYPPDALCSESYHFCLHGKR